METVEDKRTMDTLISLSVLIHMKLFLFFGWEALDPFHPHYANLASSGGGT